MNKVFLTGNLTRDPEVRYTPTGKAVSKMGIAVQKRNKNAETGQYDVDFFNLTAWEKTAEFCGRYFRKGSRVLVEGRLQTYSYTGQDGVKRSGVDIQIENIEFAGAKRSGDDSGEGMSSGNKPTTPVTSRPSQQPPAEDDFGGGNSGYDEDDFIGDEIPDDKVPF